MPRGCQRAALATVSATPAQNPNRSCRGVVCIASGLDSMAHFSRVFRAHLGVPPSDYRRALAAGT